MSTIPEAKFFWRKKCGCNWWGKPSWLKLIGRLQAEGGEINEQLHPVWASKYLTDNNNHRLFHSFTVFPLIEMWCFGQNLEIFKQNGVTGYLLLFSYGSVGQKTCFETMFVFSNSNFYGSTSFSYIFYTTGAGNAVDSSIV
ncbi:hypothetical protein Zmor_017746 [Zophobas morio]|uniref:Uncharacterized protein n=1 Tax=Zophobas morio TaxID=2755281 RepID=A0AA38MCY3_9CUCU|nr:hypothetical protein Zmor_017746 [Zophobas morio]